MATKFKIAIVGVIAVLLAGIILLWMIGRENSDVFQPQKETLPPSKTLYGDFYSFLIKKDQRECAVSDKAESPVFEALAEQEYRILFRGRVIASTPCDELSMISEKENGTVKLIIESTSLPEQPCIQCVGSISFTGVVELSKLIKQYGTDIKTIQLIYKDKVVGEFSDLPPLQ